MKGIILAGGSGTRLYPLTKVVSKQLMPVYDKPMIYYPLTTLLSAGIRDILIISTFKDLPKFKALLGNGNDYGCNFEYAIQEEPNGLAEAFLIGEDFIGNDSVALILGDNIFYGSGLDKTLQANINPKGGVIFAYHVLDPNRYGVVEAWLDTGTFNSLMQASQFVQVIEDRQGQKIGCIEEMAYKMGYINKEQLIKLAKPLLKSGYGEYLQQLV